MNSLQNIFKINTNVKGVLIWLMIWDHDYKCSWVFQDENYLYTDVQRVFFLKWITDHLKLTLLNYLNSD